MLKQIASIFNIQGYHDKLTAVALKSRVEACKQQIQNADNPHKVFTATFARCAYQGAQLGAVANTPTRLLLGEGNFLEAAKHNGFYMQGEVKIFAERRAGLINYMGFCFCVSSSAVLAVICGLTTASVAKLICRSAVDGWKSGFLVGAGVAGVLVGAVCCVIGFCLGVISLIFQLIFMSVGSVIYGAYGFAAGIHSARHFKQMQAPTV